MTDDPKGTATAAGKASASRRGFLKVAGAAAASAAAASVGCAPSAETTVSDSESRQSAFGASAQRVVGFDRPLLDALGEVMLPASLGAAVRKAAVDDFVAWLDAYEPVAEEMHGYGYAEVRYLPADPAPGWRAQLNALDTLARKKLQRPFTELGMAGRREVVTAALASVRGDTLPDPLAAQHVAVALVAHWAQSPTAWNLAYGAQIAPSTCRPLGAATAKPLPIVGVTT